MPNCTVTEPLLISLWVNKILLNLYYILSCLEYEAVSGISQWKENKGYVTYVARLRTVLSEAREKLETGIIDNPLALNILSSQNM